MTGQDQCRFGSAPRATLQHHVIAEAIRAGDPRTRYTAAATDLAGLPASFVDIGSVGTFATRTLITPLGCCSPGDPPSPPSSPASPAGSTQGPIPPVLRRLCGTTLRREGCSRHDTYGGPNLPLHAHVSAGHRLTYRPQSDEHGATAGYRQPVGEAISLRSEIGSFSLYHVLDQTVIQ